MNPNNNGHQQQEAWHYQDGNMSMQYQQSSWSSSSVTNQQPTQLPLSQASQMPMLPAVQPMGFHNMHQQMHANAIAHHQSVMQHMNNVHQSMQSSMFGIQPPSLMPRMSLSQTTAQVSSPQLLQAPPERLAIMSGHVEEVESGDGETESSDSDDDESDAEDEASILHERNVARMQQEMAELERQRQTLELQNKLAAAQHQQAAQQRALEDKLAAEKRQLDEERRAMEARYLADQQNVQRQGTKMDDRLRRLEEKETKDRAAQEAKDAEMRALREENNRLAQQRYQDAEKHRQEMADLARLQAKKSQQPPSVFDTSALEKVIREVQDRQLSKADIERVIQERVADQLQGLAKQKDVDAATSQMRSALKKMPKGASLEQVQSAVNAELGKAVNDLVSKTQRTQPRLEAPSLPIDAIGAPITNSSDQSSSALVKGKGKERERRLDVQNNEQSLVSGRVSQPMDLPHDFPDNASQIGAWEDSKSSRTLKQKSLPSIAEDNTSDALVRKGKQKATAVLRTTARPENSDSGIMSDALVGKDKRNKAGDSVSSTSSQAGALQRLGNDSAGTLPSDFPDNASQIASWERSKPSKQPSKMLMPILESESAETALVRKPKRDKVHTESVTTESALVRQAKKEKAISEVSGFEGALVKKPKKDKEAQDRSDLVGALVKQAKPDKKSTVAPITNDDSALIRIGKHGKNVESAQTDALMKSSKRDKLTSLTNALTKPAQSTNDSIPTYTSVTLADIAQHMSNQPMQGVSQQFALPADFPDNASQISTWERNRGAAGQGALAGSSIIPQIQAAPGMTPGQDLVRSKKSKKEGKS